MQKKSIALHLLVSPKKELDYRKRSKAEFLQLVNNVRITKKVDVPIEVYPLSNGKYYIADGVHRAKAVQLAMLTHIDAIIYNDSIPFGPTTALNDIKVP